MKDLNEELKKNQQLEIQTEIHEDSVFEEEHSFIEGEYVEQRKTADENDAPVDVIAEGFREVQKQENMEKLGDEEPAEVEYKDTQAVVEENKEPPQAPQPLPEGLQSIMKKIEGWTGKLTKDSSLPVVNAIKSIGNASTDAELGDQLALLSKAALDYQKKRSGFRFTKSGRQRQADVNELVDAISDYLKAAPREYVERISVTLKESASSEDDIPEEYSDLYEECQQRIETIEKEEKLREAKQQLEQKKNNEMLELEHGKNLYKDWAAANGMDDQEELQRRLQEANQPQATIDDIKVIMPAAILGLEGQREEYETAYSKAQKNVYKNMGKGDKDRVILCPISYVLRDKTGKPLNEEEEKKEAWNKEWCEVVGDETKSIRRLEMLQESFDKFGKLDVPDLNEVKKIGAKAIYLRDPVTVYNAVQLALKLDNLKQYEPFVASYEGKNRLFAAKMDIWRMFSNLLKAELISENMLTQGGNWGIKSQKHTTSPRMGTGTLDESLESVEEYQTIREGAMGALENTYGKKYQNLVALSKEEKFEGILTKEQLLKRAEFNKPATDKFNANENSYNMYLTLRKEDRYMENPLYTNLCSKDAFRKETIEISRVAVAVLKKVQFDDKWQPISEEDKKNHEWNMKYLTNLNAMYVKETSKNKPTETTEEEKVATDMAMKEVEDFYKNGYELPSPDVLQKEIVDKILNKQPLQSDVIDKMLADPKQMETYKRKALSCDNVSNLLPGFKEFLRKEENAKMKAYYDASASFCFVMGAYTAINYGLSFMNHDIDYLVGMNDNPMLLTMQMEEYRKLYNTWKGQ